MIKKYLNKIVRADCVEFLRKLPSESVDLCFADPPFNLSKAYITYVDKLSTKDYLEWSKAWLTELVRITKPTGAIFIHNIPKWLIHYANFLNELAYFQHWIVWDSLARPCGTTLLPAHYGILFYTKQPSGFTFNEVRAPHKLCPKCHCFLKEYGNKPRHHFGPLLTDVWSDITRVQNKQLRQNHPCPLPEKLLERIILLASKPGDTVLDPFSGTATTATIAKALGRNFIGIDMDQEYVHFSRERLQTSTSKNYKPHHIAS